MKSLVIALAALPMLIAPLVQAAPQTPMAVVCLDQSATNLHARECGRTFPAGTPHTAYKPVAPDDLVRDCGAYSATTNTCDWNRADFKYVPFKSLAPGRSADACLTALEPNTESPHPWVEASELCKSWRATPLDKLVKKQSSIIGALAATPDTGSAPLTVTLSWAITSAPAGTVCTGSGSWSGVKELTGKQVINNVTANAAYTLTCTGMAQLGTVNVTWGNATTNVDGSTLTDLAGTRIVYGTRTDQLTQMVEVRNPQATSYQIGDLTPALYYFAAKHFTTGGIEGEQSGTASKTITGATGDSWSSTARVTVRSRPRAPTTPTVVTP